MQSEKLLMDGIQASRRPRIIANLSELWRRLSLGKQKVERRHALPWQLVEPGTRAGDVLRALGWMGRGRVASALAQLAQTLGPSEMTQLASLRTVAPGWLAQTVSDAMVARG